MQGVKPDKVNEWMAEYQCELLAHTDALRHGSRQNVGKPEPREVVKWNQEAYGEYQWRVANAIALYP
ncbi:MAG: hypothetical protein DCF15_05835 [Phormidesmis priestleyi]|uniref:Uncharacterized protein n=1 Tax=Phormidesmis priestleyi TaxID=268141 RepID=A0A2W4XL23_9CYAN|nr:MAG: hypothetical protein DCF15_05835 [Phormidesmis priestleyi]